MVDKKLRIVVTGLIAQYPLGGVAWDYGQYAAGLHRLGHDVYYFEDTGQWPYNPLEGGVSKGCDYNVDYLSRVLTQLGLENRWAYRFPFESRWYGLPDEQRRGVIETADVLINVSGCLARPSEYRRIPRLIYIDSDPVFTQIKLARGQMDYRKLVDTHDVHFSFGEAFSENMPSTGHEWRPTRQPVVLSEWHTGRSPRKAFTSVLNWTSYKPVSWQGRTFGQKDVEFRRFLDLPGRLDDSVMEIAVNAGKTRRTPYALLRQKGWQVVDPMDVCPDLDSYRDYIETSLGEWSVAKNGYVEGRPGWFSCRSACYLAAGRPVVVQDTGFNGVLPVGTGILSFRTMDEAVAAILDIGARYDEHSKAARAVAEEYFDSDKVLSRLLEQAV
jgi:hypothetical protein